MGLNDSHVNICVKIKKNRLGMLQRFLVEDIKCSDHALDLFVRPCPHDNRFNHPNRFYPDLLCPNERYRHIRTMLVQPCVSPEQWENQSVWNWFHPEQLQSSLDETDLRAV